MKRLFLLLAMVSMAVPALRADPVALFYLTSNPDSIRSFMAHSTQIDLLVPTWYQVDENGLVTGAPDSTVLKKADDDKVPLMPILAMFNKKGFHALSMNPTAQDVMNEAISANASCMVTLAFNSISRILTGSTVTGLPRW